MPLMKIFKKILLTLSLATLALPTSIAFATESDFTITNSTDIKYSTGKDYVTVETTYLREVNNNRYYYPALGEKIFHIPDLPQSKDYEIELERKFKTGTLSVVDNRGNSVKYTLEELELGNGIYVKVPNFKQTVYGSDYEILVSYQTHDLVRSVYDFVSIQAPALPEDILFEQTDEDTGTKTSFIYDLSIITDDDIKPLASAYPSGYSVSVNKGLTYYNFPSSLRLDQAPTLEFGLGQIYRFELSYDTPKTDNFIPEQYSEMFNALSTNIFDLSLPRDSAESNQRVKIQDIYPTPKKIYTDTEGNIIATFEVDANKESRIEVSGYIWVERDSLAEPKLIPNPTLEEYKVSVLESSYASTYLSDSKYWEVSDPYIKDEAEKLVGNNQYLMDIIKADYQYVNEKLEYDENKANSGNDRIGAKKALQGGGSVCMEYADSMIALLRAQGIPSRAALGYTNLTTLSDMQIDTNVRHQWVEIWIPEYGWLSVDPTYESLNMDIGQNIERVLWETFNGDDLSNIRVYSADKLSSLESSGYGIKIYAVMEDSIEDINGLMAYSDIVPVQEEYTPSTMDVINTFVKTTSLGKALVIVAPILVIIFLLIMMLIIMNIVIKRIRTRKEK